MTIQVRLFAHMAQQARSSGFGLELAPDTRLGGVKAEILRRHPGLPWPAGTMLAVNQEYAPETVVLREGDEVAVIPPVSGG
jgi:molybdopterin converting factor subunit 1